MFRVGVLRFDRVITQRTSVIFDSKSPHTVSLLHFSPFAPAFELWGGFCLVCCGISMSFTDNIL